MNPNADILNAWLDWLLQTSWQASILAGLIFCIQKLFRQYLSPKWIYAIWLLLLVPLSLFGQETDKQDVWQPFDYFVGSWKGHETGASGIGKGERTYEYIMDGTYLFFKNRSVFEPQEKNPEGEVHEDWTFFSYDTFRKKFVMRQFNSEGFVNQYTLDSLSTDDKIFRFVSESIENAPPGFRTRVTLNIENENEFNETFELAPPGKEFKVILENRWKRKKQ